MPNQANISVQNNFNGGLKTEFTGLNFPENSCTELSNCVISLIGDVFRRDGIDYEKNFNLFSINRAGAAVSSYKWNNVGGDGLTQVYVLQVGINLYFYKITAATTIAPLSTTLLASTVNITTFKAAGSSIDPSVTECQYTDGNGYLFVFHPNCDPFYCTYSSGTITANLIDVKVRDFTGVLEPGVIDNFRPPTDSVEHFYNLQNQGWAGTGAAWNATSTTNITISLGTKTFTIQSGLTITPGQVVIGTGTCLSGGVRDIVTINATVSSYSGTSLVLSINSFSGNTVTTYFSESWTLSSLSSGYINTFQSVAGVYPSNADVWWRFKDTSNNFNPSITLGQIVLSTGPAPKGSVILKAFNQIRSNNITIVSTSIRPKTGTWFQGRIWYTGVDASFPASGDMPFSTWSENIYFSQIVQSTDQLGKCYQTNDPTAENLFDLLPTDGGVIQIQGCGSIYKLFTLQNGILVFAANGIWFIAGSGGAAFEANSYTISKISNVQSIASTSFVNILGYPMFWNEEGIYYVSPSKQAGSAHTPDIGLDVVNIALGTFLTFYSNIPLQSKKYARGDYNPLTYVVNWVYRTTNESDVTSRYQLDGQLNFNTANKALYPYTIANSATSPYVHDIKYIAGPGGSTTPEPTFKYLTSRFVPNASTYSFTFSEERDETNFVDWFSIGQGLNYISSFIAGYNIKGKAMTRWQPGYVNVFSIPPNAYKVNGFFDYGNRLSGKGSSVQVITNSQSNFGVVYRRHKIRGRGLVFQLEIQSMDGQPFDIIGWSIFENINQGP